MTFEEWFEGNKYLLKPAEKTRQLFTLEDLQDAWNSAIESAATKLARGTNLYNICGDHISGQVIDSITQLKSS